MIVFDACSGAGGKTLHIATLMKNKGTIIAIDPSKNKRIQLESRLKRNGVHIVRNYSSENEEIIQKYKDSVQLVIIDAPCSSIGTLKRNPAIKWQMNPERIRKIIQLQKQILEKYALLVSKGGKLVYATCSIFPNENQNQIKKFLNSKTGKKFRFEKEETLLSHQTVGDGFYMAKLLRHS